MPRILTSGRTVGVHPYIRCRRCRCGRNGPNRTRLPCCETDESAITVGRRYSMITAMPLPGAWIPRILTSGRTVYIRRRRCRCGRNGPNRTRLPCCETDESAITVGRRYSMITATTLPGAWVPRIPAGGRTGGRSLRRCPVPAAEVPLTSLMGVQAERAIPGVWPAVLLYQAAAADITTRAALISSTVTPSTTAVKRVIFFCRFLLCHLHL